MGSAAGSKRKINVSTALKICIYHISLVIMYKFYKK